MLRLVTIPISHYCEKARWALDRAGIRYHEEPHIQGVHRIAARRAGGGRTVPVLVTADEVLSESEQILAWVDRRLAPEHRLFFERQPERSETERLCRRFDAVLGPAGRRLMYVHVLPHRDLTLRFNNRGIPPWEDRVLRMAWPFAVRWIQRDLGIRPRVEDEDEATVWREFDFVADLLADGREFIDGERFGAADLTFAALAAAVIVPPVYGVPLPQPEILPAPTADLVIRARDHPAGRHALNLFLEHRGARPLDQPG